MTIHVGPSVSRWLRFSAWLGRRWRAFLGLFALPDVESVPPVSPAPAPTPSGKLSARRRLGSPMVVPADGYIFTFRVHGILIWGSDGITQEQLSRSIEGLAPYAIRRLYALAARHARKHSAHRARELEVELQRALKDQQPWRFAWSGAAITCRPYIWVEMDEQVKLAVQPYMEELIKIDCEHGVQMRRAEYAEKLSQQWSAILTDLVGSPVADGAAELTEKELAEVVRRIVEERKAAAEKLENLMTQKVTEGDVFERSEHWDALKDLLERRASTPGNGRPPQPASPSGSPSA